MSFSLRPFNNADLAALARLHAACFAEDAWDSAALATVLAMLGTEGHVACSETAEICGVLITQCLGEDAEILTLGVAPALRRQGIAQALLADFFARARDAGAVRVVLEVAADNAAALALYQSLDFVRQGTRQNYYRRAAGTNMDAWRLRLEIARPKGR
jgi:ribosomal-protein-alanine N-acetyltransferase